MMAMTGANVLCAKGLLGLTTGPLEDRASDHPQLFILDRVVYVFD